MLSGKFKRDEAAPESRVSWVGEDKAARTNQSHPSLEEFASESFWKLLETLESIARSHGTYYIGNYIFSCLWLFVCVVVIVCLLFVVCLCFADATVPQVSIAWLLHQPAVASVVVGVRTMEQLEDNLEAVNITLTKKDVSCYVHVRT